MGIKCFCPNGHRLNVKSQLAGKRGICPQCGAKFVIPGSESDDSAAGSAPTEQTPGQMATVVSQAAAPEARTASARESAEQPSGDPAQGPADETWYVRTSDGQFGPAGLSTVREWIDLGRVASGSWVWCEGWADWKPVETQFPDSHFEAHVPTENAVPGAESRADLLIDTEVHRAPVSARRRRGSRRRRTAVVMLGVASLILLIALVYVVTQST